MTITWHMLVLVCRRAKVGSAVCARSGHRCPPATAAAGRPGGEAVIPNPVDLDPPAKAVADANPPYMFELGPDQGRGTVDAVQSGPVNKPPVDIGDTTVPGGPSRRVSVRILRPQRASRSLPLIVYLHGAGWVFGNNHHTHCARPSRTRRLLASATRRSGSPLRRTPRWVPSPWNTSYPLASASRSGGPGPAGGLVGVDAQLAHGALRSACRRCSPSSTTTTIGKRRNRQPPAG
jgi:hypothetical protein